MDVTVRIPDDLASRMGAGGDLCHGVRSKRWPPRSTSEGVSRSPILRRLLGFETSRQIDEFLKDHEVF